MLRLKDFSNAATHKFRLRDSLGDEERASKYLTDVRSFAQLVENYFREYESTPQCLEEVRWARVKGLGVGELVGHFYRFAKHKYDNNMMSGQDCNMP
jgi:hypothetical protein